MRICPKCGYCHPPYWRPAKMHNPSGDMDIARIDDLELFERKIAEQLLAAQVYRDCGKLAFNPPHEKSGHNPLSKRVSGRTKTTFGAKHDEILEGDVKSKP